jgi:hypothetical protein
MEEFDEVDCAIYVEAPDRRALVALVAELSGGRALDDARVTAPGLYLYVDRNDEADAALRTTPDEGFLYFAFELEVYAHERPATALVTRLLEELWARGWPAVAACEYEDELPDRGGRRWRAAPS